MSKHDILCMRERLAKAADKAIDDFISDHQGNLGMADMPPRLIVDAILAEMETPSVAVIDAAYKAEAEYDNGTIDAWCGLSSAFRAMVRAIREGK